MKKLLLLLLLLLPLCVVPVQANDHDDRDRYHDVLNKYHDLKDRFSHLLDRRARLGSNRRIDYKIQRISELKQDIGYALDRHEASPKQLSKNCDVMADLITDAENEYRARTSDYPPRREEHRRYFFGW